MRASVMGVGARGPLGSSSLQVALAARAGLFEPRAVEHLRDRRGREIGICLSAALGAHLHGYERLLALAGPALCEAAADGRGGDLGSVPVPLIVALPETGRVDDDPRLGSAFIADLAAHSGVSLDLSSSRVVRAGHAAGGQALAAALEMLDAGVGEVLVGGVDSYYHPALLRELDDAGRLHAMGVSDGFVPGEAAAFALITTRQGAGALAHLLAIELGRDSASERGLAGDAATMATLVDRARAQLVAPAQADPALWVLVDVDNQSRRIHEWGQLIIKRRLPEPFVEQRVSAAFGSLGTASGATAIGLACELWRVGGAPAARALVLLHSDGAERAVIALERAG